MDDWQKEWGIPNNMVDIYAAGTVIETLEQFYRQYSDVVAIRMLENLSIGFGYAIVELRDGRFAEAVILKRSDDILYRVVPEQPFSRRNTQLPLVYLEDHHSSAAEEEFKNKMLIVHEMQPEQEEQRMPPHQDSPSNIQNALNYDCLQKIFEYLPLADLCSVADVCVTFKINADKVFTRRFSNAMPEVDDLCRFESLVRNFGTKIKSLSIRGSLPGGSIFEEDFRRNALLLILVAYCSGSNCQLNKLNFSYFDVESHWHNSLRSLFARLKHLRLEESVVGNLLTFCDELTELNLIGDDSGITDVSDVTLTTKLRKLVKLSIQNFEISSELVVFLDVSTAMKCLKIRNWDECKVPINELCTKFPNLEQLELYELFWVDELVTAAEMKSRLTQMKNLKKLGLDGDFPDYLFEGEDFFQILTDAKVTIEWLVIDATFLLEGIRKLKDLKVLEFYLYSNEAIELIDLLRYLPQLNQLRVHSIGVYKLDETDLTEMIRCAKQLTFIYFGEWNNHIIGDDNYDEILGLVKRRKQKNKLKIEIRSSNENLLMVEKNKIEKNRRLLEVQFLPEICAGNPHF